MEYPGALDHVMNRRDLRAPIFQDDSDRQRFLETFAEACAKSGWKPHAMCLRHLNRRLYEPDKEKQR